jgi:predicted secreted hydrolase
MPRWAFVLAVVALGALALGAAFKVAAPDYAWSFPRDHWSHDGYRTEWWYFTGHLEARDEPGRVFGYQFTVFRVGLLPEKPALRSEWSARNLVMAHAAIIDLSRSEHRFSDLLYREAPLLGAFGAPPDPMIAKVIAPAGTAGLWTLKWNGEGFDFEMRDDERRMAFRLTTRPTKPLVLQGPNGYSRKSGESSAASQYCSFTRLATEGTLELDGKTYDVRGESWMDREFGSSQLSSGQVGWDWFALRLADGRDLMLYLMRRQDGGVDYRNGTLVDRDGNARYLSASEWSVRPTASWKSPETGAAYPSRWTIDVPSAGLRLDVVPDFSDQENRGRIPHSPYYWEGSVRALDPSGRPLGRGFVELTGYGERNRPPV